MGNMTDTTLPADTAEPSENHRRIRSFVLRQGRLTKGQERALETGWPVFGLDYAPALLEFTQTVGRADSKRLLEIGFGMGDATAKIAQTLPDCDFLAVEVHTPGVGSLLKLMQEGDIQNIRIIQHDIEFGDCRLVLGDLRLHFGLSERQAVEFDIRPLGKH